MRRSVGLIAILGVLLHALALVHHHLVMMADALPTAALAGDGPRVAAAFPYGAVPVCRGAGATSLDDPATGEPGEDSPSPAQRPLPCPFCSGSASTYAIAPTAIAFLVPTDAGALGPTTSVERPREPASAAHPPARAPPPAT
jgi:hypothetical protein